MKKLLALLISSVLFFSCTSIAVKKMDDGKADVKFETSVEKVKDKDYLVITDKKSKKSWVISYEDWDKLYKTRTYWNTVTTEKPKIASVIEEEGYIVVSLVYEYENPETKKTEKILGAKVYVPKKYINDDVKKQLEIYRGATIGTATYGAGVTILIIILLIIFL